MTNEECKKYLIKLYGMADITDAYGDMDDTTPYEEALDMAIKALEQQPLHGYKIDFFELGATLWLSTFNTDSATECFTAVQELKKRLEGDTT